jgi:hypothetical protein
MKNKKGFLLAEETLKIIIAVISISFLIYLLVSLYMSGKDSKDLELARASLEHLVEEINSERVEVEIYNPTNKLGTYWWMFIWPYGEDKIIPNSCSNIGWKKCICICGIRSFTGWTKESAKDKCDKRGVCLELDKELKINNPAFLRGENAFELKDLPIQLQINYESGEIIRKK